MDRNIFAAMFSALCFNISKSSVLLDLHAHVIPLGTLQDFLSCTGAPSYQETDIFLAKQTLNLSKLFYLFQK